MTDEILQVLLQDRICAEALAAMVSAICQGNIASSVRRRLCRCRLVALPKPDNTVRPIAVGDALLKLSARVLFAKHRRQISTYFGNLQFGCLAPNGAESVVHSARADVLGGSFAATLDMKNAFNTIKRTSIASELYAVPAFQPFWNIFNLEYASPSELLFFHNGVLFSTIMSEEGTRQGSALGGFFFCVGIQPLLRDLAARFPDVRIYAYMDDITMTCPSEQRLAEAVLFAKLAFADLGLQLNPEKSEWFGQAAPPHIVTHLLRARPRILKVLGAFLGEAELVTTTIIEKMKKHDVFFTRLRGLDPSSAAFALLRSCALPRLNYALRCHTPDTTAQAAEAFDRNVFETLLLWSRVVPSDRIASQAALPQRLGGLGLCRQLQIARFAYEASVAHAFRAIPRASAPAAPPPQPPTQQAATEQHHEQQRTRLLTEFPSLERHLSECSQKGAGAWLTASRLDFRGPAFAAALRYRLRAPPAGQPSLLVCPGCRATLPDDDFDEHAAGCVKIAGQNATKKHHAIVNLLAQMCARAGVACDKEPRDLQAYNCHGCGSLVSAAGRDTHKNNCHGKFSRTGPDLRITWHNGATTVYDVTVVHTTAPSHANTRPGRIVDKKVADKTAFYTPLLAGEPFVVLPVRALGKIEDETRALIKTLSTIAETDPREALEEVSVALARGVGLSLVEARRAHRHA